MRYSCGVAQRGQTVVTREVQREGRRIIFVSDSNFQQELLIRDFSKLRFKACRSVFFRGPPVTGVRFIDATLIRDRDTLPYSDYLLFPDGNKKSVDDLTVGQWATLIDVPRPVVEPALCY